jgi:hypothetical protein
MGKSKIFVAALATLAWTAPALAIVGETTVKVADGGTPIPQATVTITFKNQAGKPIQTVKRPTVARGAKAGTRTVRIPDNAKTADISVTTASGKTTTRADLDVSSLNDKEITIDVPGGNAPPQTARVFPRPGAPVEPVPALIYPGGGGMPIAIGGSWTSIPQVSGGTRFVGGAETSIVDSRRTIPGVTAALGVAVPVAFADYFSVIGSFNGFNDTVSGSVPVGTPSAFTYIFPNPASGSTGLGPTATGQNVTINTRGQFWDLSLGPTFRVPAGSVFANPTRSFWTYGIGLRYRYMNVDHTIIQQSPTFADLNQTINLNLRSHFIGPNFAVGFEAVQPLPSGVFGGASAFVSPGALITDANARQASRCGPCGGGSPEFDLVLQRGFSDSSLAVMAGVNGYAGYRFNPNFRIQGEVSYQYLSQLKSLAVPTSPLRQPIALTSDSSDMLSIGGRLVFDFNPPPP